VAVAKGEAAAASAIAQAASKRLIDFIMNSPLVVDGLDDAIAPEFNVRERMALLPDF
jgi:hypothetical protein